MAKTKKAKKGTKTKAKAKPAKKAVGKKKSAARAKKPTAAKKAAPKKAAAKKAAPKKKTNGKKAAAKVAPLPPPADEDMGGEPTPVEMPTMPTGHAGEDMEVGGGDDDLEMA